MAKTQTGYPLSFCFFSNNLEGTNTTFALKPLPNGFLSEKGKHSQGKGPEVSRDGKERLKCHGQEPYFGLI
jgi:hypothetical protein